MRLVAGAAPPRGTVGNGRLPLVPTFERAKCELGFGREVTGSPCAQTHEQANKHTNKQTNKHTNK